MFRPPLLRSNAYSYALAYSALMTILVMYLCYHRPEGLEKDCPRRFHGGSPTFEGSCWCGWDSYCMCTPSLAIDAILEWSDGDSTGEARIVLVQRRDSGQVAIVGGFVNVGETLDDAVRREVLEETGLAVQHLRRLEVYDSPSRDLRRHTVSVAYAATASGQPRAGDDAKQVQALAVEEVADMAARGAMAFDHSRIIKDYLRLRVGDGGRRPLAAAVP